ncbi:DUF2946 family protein [Novosphingobium sp.]|uniref:DUF2946 family protein n=1 Tax=Novosphingobium sp. TaxID=1874826 RepID=UPI003D0B08A8
MTCFRAFFLRYRALALAVIALALAMKALVPAGYMIGGDAKVLTVRVCDGYADNHAIVIVAKGAAHNDAGKALHDHQACPFSALALAHMRGADPIQLALALAFIVLLGIIAPVAVTPRAFARLRPPLRAPPFPA